MKGASTPVSLTKYVSRRLPAKGKGWAMFRCTNYTAEGLLVKHWSNQEVDSSSTCDSIDDFPCNKNREAL